MKEGLTLSVPSTKPKPPQRIHRPRQLKQNICQPLQISEGFSTIHLKANFSKLVTSEATEMIELNKKVAQLKSQITIGKENLKRVYQQKQNMISCQIKQWKQSMSELQILKISYKNIKESKVSGREALGVSFSNLEQLQAKLQEMIDMEIG